MSQKTAKKPARKGITHIRRHLKNTTLWFKYLGRKAKLRKIFRIKTLAMKQFVLLTKRFQNATQKLRTIPRPQYATVRKTLMHRNSLVIAVILTMLIVNMAATNKSKQSPTILSSTTTSESKPSSWCEVCRAKEITIPTIFFSDKKIAEMNFDVATKTWPTPISGIATPKETVANNIIIFGHSIWSGKQSHFSRISMLKLGNEIVITDQFDKNHVFVISSLHLVDRFTGDAVHEKPELQLTLITSARQNGEWLLPTNLDDSVEDTVNDTSKYAILTITAKPKSQ